MHRIQFLAFANAIGYNHISFLVLIFFWAKSRRTWDILPLGYIFYLQVAVPFYDLRKEIYCHGKNGFFGFYMKYDTTKEDPEILLLFAKEFFYTTKGFSEAFALIRKS